MAHRPLVSVIIVTYNRRAEVDLCLKSVLRSDYDNCEVIVIDNASMDDTVKVLERKYKDRIHLIKSSKNLMAGGGRNLGAKHARGKYLVFVDSDNVVDKQMISKLVNGIIHLKFAGMVGPLMYYYKDPKQIWWAGADINMWTSKTTYVGNNKIDNGQYNKIQEVGHIPNVFMVKKSVWDRVGGIDSDYVMHYEESDLSEKIRRIGYKAYMIPNAKTWHNASNENEGQFWIRTLGGNDNLIRNYYTARNRVLFMKKNASAIQTSVFLCFVLPIFTLFYVYNVIRAKEYKVLEYYLKGTLDGYRYGIFKILNNRFR